MAQLWHDYDGLVSLKRQQKKNSSPYYFSLDHTFGLSHPPLRSFTAPSKWTAAVPGLCGQTSGFFCFRSALIFETLDMFSPDEFPPLGASIPPGDRAANQKNSASRGCWSRASDAATPMCSPREVLSLAPASQDGGKGIASPEFTPQTSNPPTVQRCPEVSSLDSASESDRQNDTQKSVAKVKSTESTPERSRPASPDGRNQVKSADTTPKESRSRPENTCSDVELQCTASVPAERSPNLQSRCSDVSQPSAPTYRAIQRQESDDEGRILPEKPAGAWSLILAGSSIVPSRNIPHFYTAGSGDGQEKEPEAAKSWMLNPDEFPALPSGRKTIGATLERENRHGVRKRKTTAEHLVTDVAPPPQNASKGVASQRTKNNEQVENSVTVTSGTMNRTLLEQEENLVSDSARLVSAPGTSTEPVTPEPTPEAEAVELLPAAGKQNENLSSRDTPTGGTRCASVEQTPDVPTITPKDVPTTDATVKAAPEVEESTPNREIPAYERDARSAQEEPTDLTPDVPTNHSRDIAPPIRTVPVEPPPDDAPALNPRNVPSVDDNSVPVKPSPVETKPVPEPTPELTPTFYPKEASPGGSPAVPAQPAEGAPLFSPEDFPALGSSGSTTMTRHQFRPSPAVVTQRSSAGSPAVSSTTPSGEQSPPSCTPSSGESTPTASGAEAGPLLPTETTQSHFESATPPAGTSRSHVTQQQNGGTSQVEEMKQIITKLVQDTDKILTEKRDDQEALCLTAEVLKVLERKITAFILGSKMAAASPWSLQQLRGFLHADRTGRKFRHPAAFHRYIRILGVMPHAYFRSALEAAIDHVTTARNQLDVSDVRRRPEC